MSGLRWLWRQLTSMRTALILLFLLALASVPGSLFPQRGTSPLKVSQYLRDHPKLGPFLDSIHMFDVFASPWFAAIYLLLFVSLAGCVLPRAWVHFNELRGLPPEAPRNLSRLPTHVAWTSHAQADVVLPNVVGEWKRARWRVRQEGSWIAAEKGYARESGNVMFHLSLLVLLVSVGLGSATGFKGTVIVREGSGFADNVTQFDTFTPGHFYSADKLPPFSFTLDDFKADYQVGGQQNGAARLFNARVTFKKTQSATATKHLIEVNDPLRIDGVSVYLVGHGYAPMFTVKDAKGNVVYKDAAVFLPQDGNFTSTGVVKAPDTVPQLGLQGFFLPTATKDLTFGPRSTFPAALDPQVFISAWVGDLGLDSGLPQSVYKLDTTKMKRIGIEELKPGEGWKLPGGKGTVEFTGFKEWAAFSITRDAGKGWALGSSMVAIFGLCLSLLVPRRRVWLRITAQESGGSLYEVAGLSKTEAPGLTAEIEKLAAHVRKYAPEVAHVD